MTEAVLTEAAKAYGRIETRLAVASEVVRLFENLEKDRRISQSGLAKRLGVSRARVSKLLTGPGNWTLDTLADVLSGMDAKLTRIEARPRSLIGRANSRHDWLEPGDMTPIVSTVGWRVAGDAPAATASALSQPKVTLKANLL